MLVLCQQAPFSVLFKAVVLAVEGAIFKHSRNAISDVVLGLQWWATIGAKSGPHSGAIQAPLQVPFHHSSIVFGGAAHYIQHQPRHHRPQAFMIFILAWEARIKVGMEESGLHSNGCSPSQLWRRSHRYRKGCSPSRWPRHAWCCWGWSSPRLKIRKMGLWY